MSERLSDGTVYALADIVSAALPGRTCVVANRRYDYMALDLYPTGEYPSGDPLVAGTSRQVYLYLQGMRQAQALAC